MSALARGRALSQRLSRFPRRTLMQRFVKERPSPGIDRHRKLFRGGKARHHDGLTDRLLIQTPGAKS